VHFTIHQPPVITPDIEELLLDAGTDSSSLGDDSKFTARVSPDVSVDNFATVKLVVDTAKLHFFDPATGDKIGAVTPSA
jgi:multiple sugar transport system ATP-binding protein